MLIQNLRDEYNRLTGNEMYLKTIKLKKFLQQNNFQGDFTDIDIFLSQLFQQQNSKKIDYNQFKEIIGVLIENNMIDCSIQSQSDLSQLQIQHIKQLQNFLKKQKNKQIIEQLFWNSKSFFENLCSLGKNEQYLYFKEFRYFCQCFQLYPIQINLKQLTLCFQTISQGKQYINHNEFLEVLVLIYFQIYKGSLNYKDFGIFLMKLDVSGGWEILGQKIGRFTSGSKFSNKIVQKGKNFTN